MFTGIIQDIGEITAIDKNGDWIATVATSLPLEKTALGASIAHSGICLTVIDKAPLPLAGTCEAGAKGDLGVAFATRDGGGLPPQKQHQTIGTSPPFIPPASGGEYGWIYKVQLSQETISRTTALQWRNGSRINLETALRVGDELGGHYVSGHVDGIARLVAKTAMGDSLKLDFEAPSELARFIAAKGSVTLDGVSLTVNSVSGPRFSITIIPHTQKETTLGTLEPGGEVNLEIDMLARYVERMQSMT